MLPHDFAMLNWNCERTCICLPGMEQKAIKEEYMKNKIYKITGCIKSRYVRTFLIVNYFYKYNKWCYIKISDP